MGVGGIMIVRWLVRKAMYRVPTSVRPSKRETICIQSKEKGQLLNGTFSKLLGMVPFNQALTISKQKMTFDLDIPVALDGLKICHLSDLHYTGHIGVEYFKRVVEQVNAFEPDLIFITGDLIDETECLEWIEPTFGQLRATVGVFYVLGNHDLGIRDEELLRSKLHDSGLQQTSGKWCEIEYQGAKILITGNALPWYRDAELLGKEPHGKSGLKILLSHSPDQLNWAEQYDFDLMLAGHTHGGQIRLPIIGPIIAPSRFGVKYASGTFKIGKMLLHVSRGISGNKPIRIACPPEIGMFTIKST